MTIFAQVQAGDGRAGPVVDGFKPWLNVADREQLIVMAARKFIRERGIVRGQPPQKFTVWSYAEGDPLHPNGRPKRVITTTMETNPV